MDKFKAELVTTGLAPTGARTQSLSILINGMAKSEPLDAERLVDDDYAVKFFEKCFILIERIREDLDKAASHFEVKTQGNERVLTNDIEEFQSGTASGEYRATEEQHGYNFSDRFDWKD